MSETREDFKDAADWEKKYRPIKRGNGTRLRNNGTLFDRQGDDRKFVNRMEPHGARAALAEWRQRHRLPSRVPEGLGPPRRSWIPQ
jgi:hypothetical protein